MSRENELYADSAQAREMDRRFDQGNLLQVAQDPERAREANEKWLARCRAVDEQQRIVSKALVQRGIEQLEAFFGRRS